MDATAILAKTRMLTPRSIGTSVVNWRKRKNAQHALTDLKTLQGIVDELPLEDPCQALEQVNHWLRTLNQSTAIKPERRYAVIDKLDAATRTGQQQLLDRYVTLAPARCVEGKRIWQTMTAFWTLLGTAYLVCARQCGDSGETPIALRPPLPVLAARGMRALRYQIKWLLLRDPHRSLGRAALLCGACGICRRRRATARSVCGLRCPHFAERRVRAAGDVLVGVAQWVAAGGAGCGRTSGRAFHAKFPPAAAAGEGLRFLLRSVRGASAVALDANVPMERYHTLL
jgi:hypothetical protein